MDNNPNDSASQEMDGGEADLVDSLATQQDSTMESGDNANNSQLDQGQSAQKSNMIPYQRFQETVRKANEYKKQYEQLKAQQAIKQVPEVKQADTKRESKYSKYNLPPLKSDYNDYEEFWEDMTERQKALSKAEADEEAQAVQLKQTQYNEQAAEAREILGDEFDPFKEFARKHYEKRPGSKIEILDLVAIYQDQAGEKSTEKPIRGAKINTGSRNAAGKDTRHISEVSDTEIAEGVLASFGR